MIFKYENTPFRFYQGVEKALSISRHPQWMPLKLLELQRERCPHFHLINRLNIISFAPKFPFIGLNRNRPCYKQLNCLLKYVILRMSHIFLIGKIWQHTSYCRHQVPN